MMPQPPKYIIFSVSSCFFPLYVAVKIVTPFIKLHFRVEVNREISERCVVLYVLQFPTAQLGISPLWPSLIRITRDQPPLSE